MGVLGWLRSVVGIRGRRDETYVPSVEGSPTDLEMQSALHTLQQMVRLAVFGEIGGEKPQKDNRAASWWGGNFLGKEGEVVPVCEKSGRLMHPLVQIRVDELPEIPPALSKLALLTIWMDLEDIPLDDAENGKGFAVRTYPSTAGLVPIGPGYRESADLPTFPVLWRATALEQPSWDDIAFKIPDGVARSNQSEWFFESQYATETNKYQRTCPVKLGGWPTWIQGENWPEDAEFYLQIDSTDKGRFYVGDSGSIYLFQTPSGWVIRSDFY
ncbi:DUF1963 domain-containing protein [Agrobacterium rhizogenes]|uniref:DUF1963 domain-containing protein n=2 Tax=Rhizobium rhizogenes TaxID=359 RepID=B9J8A1_RHIR8|nr:MULTISPECIES: DUF1963 domain-containing protein [Rhizobium]ACM25288.1 hypothetical protein Arad_0644 [Rhizobium rhizogenes K84]KAA6486971.1 DUF1963 domain-containing protein [Agrobacterium sp. ICMP 7243]OCJ21642.1 hypothetical protein A6U88_09775 [Agrobacterium sp. B131/95]EJK82798.1 protein of unknown function (DUF1963) [Rhizobium sp. AP16]MDJ1633301.1 DUF1963 domain-containing protein [Rhizobium rhizogenes]